MPRISLCATALALAFAPTLGASEAVTRPQVLDAIRIFEASAPCNLASSTPAQDACDAVARACGTIARFALESDDVVVDLGMDSVPWCDVRKGLPELSRSGERGILLAAYLSGSIKAQLLSGKQDPNPLPGWVAMLHAYRAMKIRNGVAVPEVEALVARQMDGTLEAYAAAALQRSRDGLQKAYGAGGDTSRPVETAAVRP